MHGSANMPIACASCGGRNVRLPTTIGTGGLNALSPMGRLNSLGANLAKIPSINNAFMAAVLFFHPSGFHKNQL